MKIWGLLLLLFIPYSLLAQSASTKRELLHLTDQEIQIVWHWEDRFSRQEQQKLKKWLFTITYGVEQTLGIYPFEVHYYIHRRNFASEPVPWANTDRNYKQSVHFHVDPSFSFQEFIDDWTAPHEISHLSIPFVGRNQSWFSEGST